MLISAAAIAAAAAGTLRLTSASAATAPLQITATTGMIADAARQIGGQYAVVKGLMGPGVDPHAYRQTRTDILALARADLVLWHGLYLEAQMEGFFRDFGQDRFVLAAAEAVPRDLLIPHDDYENKFDPHVWMAPERWVYVVRAIRDAMINREPEFTAAFTANAEKHLTDIATLSTYAKQALATVPENQRVLVTAHDAFNYFGDAYSFEVVGIQGISTESEAGLNRVAELVNLLVSRQVRAVFVESSVSDRNIRALIEGAAAKGHEVAIGGELFSDAMGEPGNYEGTYLGMIDHNVTTIARALGGEAPARGMNGRLRAAA
jgi:manganese/zinc/iron transport system substrate-binding protein